MMPAGPDSPRKQLDIRAPRARFDNSELFVRLDAVCALPTHDDIRQTTTGTKGTHILASNSEQKNLGHVTKIESHASPIGTIIFSDLVPNKIGLIRESPPSHRFHAL